MKKVLILLTVLALVFSCTAAFAELDLFPEDHEEAAGEPVDDTINIGNPTKFSGFLYSSLWGNNATDSDIRALIGGCNLVYNASGMVFQQDPTIVKSIEYVDLDDGTRTYIVELNDGLRFSDGTPITAQNYIFTVLLQASPAANELGGTTKVYDYIVGYEDYVSGASEKFAGLRAVDDHTLTVRVKADCIPFFYEYSYLSIEPSPIDVLAPGCEVVTDDTGSYLNGEFTTAGLEEILFGENGYMYFPSVTPGPFMLTAVDRAAGTLSMQKNPYYPGNYEGQVPAVEYLTLQPVEEKDMCEALENGTIDLMTRVINTDTILAGLELLEFNPATYPRSGLSLISFACEDDEPVTSSEAVRKAVRLCFDRDTFITDYTGDTGIAVDGYYGIGQWETQAALGVTYPGVNEHDEDEEVPEDQLAVEAELLAMWQELNMDGVTVYEFDTEAAEQLLIADGWTLNENGEEFVKGTDTVRWKDLAAVEEPEEAAEETAEEAAEETAEEAAPAEKQLVPLQLRWAKSENNAAADLLEEMLVPELEAVGFEVKITVMPFTEMLTYYYRETERTYNMFFLGTNFEDVYDPYYTYNPDAIWQGRVNTTGFSDEKLLEIALAMRSTERREIVEYVRRWIEFQERYSEVLPIIPVYSNTYYDFYTEQIEVYQPAMHGTWTNALLYAKYALGGAEEESNWDLF